MMNEGIYFIVVNKNEEIMLKKSLKEHNIKRCKYRKTSKYNYGFLTVRTYSIVTDNETFNSIVEDIGLIRIL